MIFRAMMLAVLPAAAFAQEGAVDCASATSQVEMNRCAAQELEQADADLNAAWTDAMGRMHEVDEGLPQDRRGAAEALRAAQRAWITVRDRGCEAEGWSYDGGTIRPLVELTCKAEATKARAAVLRDVAKRPDQ